MALGTGSSGDGKWAVNGRFLSEPFSGVQRVAHGFLHTLSGSGHRLVCPTGSEPDWWQGPTAQMRLPPGRAGRPIWEQLLLPLVTRHQPLLSLANTAPLLSPDAVYVHDVAFRVHPEWFRPSFRWSYGRATVRAAAASPCLLVNSHFTADELTRYLGVSSHTITVISPGVDAHFTRPPDDTIEELRRRRGLPRRFLLMVGSVDPRKGLDVAARAAVTTSIPLVLAGGASSNFAKEELPQSTVWLGAVGETELPALYASATALLYPSRYEGFGLPPLEAMGCGTPVIASDIPPLRETVSGAALLVPTDDTEAWVAAVRNLTASSALRQEMVQSGYRKVRAFSWHEAGRHLAEVLGSR